MVPVGMKGDSIYLFISCVVVLDQFVSPHIPNLNGSICRRSDSTSSVRTKLAAQHWVFVIVEWDDRCRPFKIPYFYSLVVRTTEHKSLIRGYVYLSNPIGMSNVGLPELPCQTPHLHSLVSRTRDQKLVLFLGQTQLENGSGVSFDWRTFGLPT